MKKFIKFIKFFLYTMLVPVLSVYLLQDELSVWYDVTLWFFGLLSALSILVYSVPDLRLASVTETKHRMIAEKLYQPIILALTGAFMTGLFLITQNYFVAFLYMLAVFCTWHLRVMAIRVLRLEMAFYEEEKRQKTKGKIV